ncbi:hypothetical protein NODU109028_05120 [Nocardioides dubius]|uniref:Uncharacterized protein n=1 Tax=Nocardioides dubius TaxID=317019 RepID=A0ABN1TMR1_9ACTN
MVTAHSPVWLISRDEIVVAELIALVGVFIWLAALTWFVVSDALRARAHHRDHPRDPNKHFHLHHR